MYQFFLIFSLILVSRCTYAFTPFKSCQTPKSCSDGLPINYPFYSTRIHFELPLDYDQRLGYPSVCGYSDFELYCKNGKTAINVSQISSNLVETGTLSKSFYVLNMSIPSSSKDILRKSIDLGDFNVLDSECPKPDTKIGNYPLFTLARTGKAGLISIFYNCSQYPPHLPHITCLEYNNSKRSYAFQGIADYSNRHYFEGTPQGGFDWRGNCEDGVLLELGRDIYDGHIGRVFDTKSFRSTLQLGTRFEWGTPQYCNGCEETGGRCTFQLYNTDEYPKCRCDDDEYYSDRTASICNLAPAATPPPIPTALIKTRAPTAAAGFSLLVKIIMSVSAGISGVLLVLFLVYRNRIISSCKNNHCFRRMMKKPTNVDLFLEIYGDLALQRYVYSDIKRMTSSFENTLGQGGYGTVFKGKLTDGSLVAVKVLKESKGNGEDFINEVATIGRTNHINVVRLLGFCSDGSKRALVYEFMTNGSLERFIHNKDKNEEESSTTSLLLGWDKLYEIAVGIAKGLEYLHTGCNTRILHFDIKPHNILLDDDFCPKIADFGLAKICATRDSVVSMLAGRGTVGYIAPEVYCRNFGGVSYKSDVYSYGMMMLEMIGGRKNIDLNVGNTSEIYFPQWVYNHLQKDVIIEASEEAFKEEITRKMILVALWCIQTHPKSRPSMSKVVEMLEGVIEDLELPPNPFAESPPSSTSIMQ